MAAKKFYGAGLADVDLSHLKGKLIVIEGADGSGRSTLITMVRDWLEGRGYPTVDVGLKRSTLVSEELEAAMSGHTLLPSTLSLFYATDFADQFENKILPALRSGFIVLADRYIYTLMARDIVRGADPGWIRDVYGIALVPDAVFYLLVSARNLAIRNLQKNGVLDFWESGMDFQVEGNLYECFVKYQRMMQREFRRMQAEYGFTTIDGNRTPRVVFRDLQERLSEVLWPSETPDAGPAT